MAITSSNPPSWKVWSILTIGILSVSTAAIFIRFALEAANTRGVGFSLVIAACRLTMASIIFLPAWRIFKRDRFQSNALFFSGAAGLFLAIHFAAWITSLSYTSIAASTALVTTNPIWVAIISWLWFKEKPSLMTIGGIAIALTGSIIVSLGGSETSVGENPLLGNFLALAGSWAVSLYFLLGREAQRRGLSIGSHAVLTYTTAAIVLLPLPLFFGMGYTGYPTAVYVAIFLMALFPQAIGHTSLNWSVRWISPTLVTLTILAEPVGAGILGLLVFGENPGIQVLMGAIVVLVGVGVAAIGTQQETA